MLRTCHDQQLESNEACAVCGSTVAQRIEFDRTKRLSVGLNTWPAGERQAQALETAHEHAQALVEECRVRTWVEFQLRDAHHRPLVGEPVTIALPDGSEERVRSDPRGVVRVEHLLPGDVDAVRLALPERADGAWRALPAEPPDRASDDRFRLPPPPPSPPAPSAPSRSAAPAPPRRGG